MSMELYEKLGLLEEKLIGLSDGLKAKEEERQRLQSEYDDLFSRFSLLEQELAALRSEKEAAKVRLEDLLNRI